MVREGGGEGVRTRIKRRVLDDLPMRTTTVGGSRSSIICDGHAISS
jgi:hypothetical protein